MHTSGWIVTITDDQAARTLAEVAPLTLGERIGSRIPAVLETTDPQAAHDWHDWAITQPGIANVEVVFVHWEETEVAHAIV